ncbi:AmmeMemoRadiSam system protein B [Thermodesulfobacteriota bacterium]
MNNKILVSLLTILSITIFLGLNAFQASGEGKTHPKNVSQKIRPPAVAGSYYPGSASRLRETVTTMLNNTPEVTPRGKILAAIAPHAGHICSGGVTAHTFKQLSDLDFDTLVIIGHDSYRNAVAFTCPVDYFQTPLGKVPVDREMIEKMQEFNSGIKPNLSIHAREHSIEIQLPFLQVLGKECKIVPILFGNPSPENCRIMADAIIRAAGEKNVFVLASTDMSHYPTYESANIMDRSTLDVLKALDINKLFRHLVAQIKKGSVPNLQTPMCAVGGVGTAILFAKYHGADQIQILRYANSGDTCSRDKGRVVGYSSVLMVK